MPIHWPETSKFCGILSLRVGVYIFVIGSTIFNCWITYFVWSLFVGFTRIEWDSGLIEIIEDSTEIENWRTILYTVLLSVTITVNAYKVVEVLSFVGLLCGVWMKRPTIIKTHVYFSVINWIVGVLLSFIVSLFMEIIGRLIILFLILIHAYMILNTRSLYLQMSGKSRVVLTSDNALDPAALEANTTSHPSNEFVQTTAPHCTTCHCYQTTATSISNEIVSNHIINSNTSTAQSTPMTESTNFTKQTNNKRILNNNRHTLLDLKGEQPSGVQNQFELSRRNNTQSSDSVDQAENDERVREEQSSMDDKKDNISVVYDENQLTVGMSSLFEENPKARMAHLRVRHSDNREPSTS